MSHTVFEFARKATLTRMACYAGSTALAESTATFMVDRLDDYSARRAHRSTVGHWEVT